MTVMHVWQVTMLVPQTNVLMHVRVWLADAVDRRTRRVLQNELRELRKMVRNPIVLVTHDLDEAASLADRLCVHDMGETLQTGRPADVLAAPVSPRVRYALDLREGDDPADGNSGP